MSIPAITPSAVKIDKLIARVADGDIKIPAFQRHFVWDQEQVIELLDSINKYSYTANEDALVKQKFTKSSPLVRAFLLLLAQNNPVDLVNGNKVDLGKALNGSLRARLC